MRTATKMFAFSAFFSLGVGTVYWLLSHERAGAVLLLFMFLAPLFIAGYLLLRARRLWLPEDDAEGRPGGGAGVDIGRFHAASIWPIVTALGAGLAVLGAVYGRWLALAGGTVMAAAVVGFMRESRG